MNVTISRRYDFEAAHFLPFVPDGHKCRRMHGHSYVLEVFVTGPVQESGPEQGMVVDFATIDAVGQGLRALVDHTPLNESIHENPTVENVAPVIHRRFAEALSWCSIRIVLHEGPRSACWFPPLEDRGDDDEG